MAKQSDMEPVHTTEYLAFWHRESKPKTEIWQVASYRGIHLGVIKWYAQWRQYCFFPSEATVFNRTCMNEISEFIDTQMEARKASG